MMIDRWDRQTDIINTSAGVAF